jgi:hypothetical protein
MMKRSLLIGLPSTLLILTSAMSGVGWYYTGELEKGAFIVEHALEEFSIIVSAAGNGTVTLRLPEGTDPEDSPGTMGIAWTAGSSMVGPIISTDGQETVRTLVGVTSPEIGEMIRFDKFVFAEDPKIAHGIEFAEVSFPAPLGSLGAWYVDGEANTWAIFVHGMGSTRREALRMLPVVVQAGLPALILDYRNDVGAPADPSTYYQYGLTEWEDLEGAVRYAINGGADDVLLVGYSMGGAIAINFLLQSDLAHEVSALVLDSPMLDFSATVDLGARNRGIPRSVTAFAKVIAGWRLDVDWSALDYLNRADDIDVPILLFHSETDGRVPVSTSDELAEVRPDIVTYERYETGAHVGGWNLDRRRYEQAVRRFVSGVTNQAGSG